MFALSMDYCGERGIPYGDFLAWDDLSRNAALAWQNRRNATCGSCGTVKADWMTTGPDGQPVEQVPPPLAIEDHWCPGCDALARARTARGKDADPSVHLVFRRASNDEPDAGGPSPS